MRRVIVSDSSGLVSLISKTDKNHPLARKVIRKLGSLHGIVVIPCEVYSETLNIVGKKIGHRTAIATATIIHRSEAFHVSDSTVKVRDVAFDKFKKQAESVSFTDCIVMAFADEYRTKDIFGFDDVFAKNGYIRLGLDGEN